MVSMSRGLGCAGGYPPSLCSWKMTLAPSAVADVAVTGRPHAQWDEHECVWRETQPLTAMGKLMKPALRAMWR